MWVGTAEGLLHLHQGRIDRFSVTDGLSGNFIRNIFEDREGSVWVSTENGLDRFREFAAPTISVNQGLSTSAVYVLQATPDGSIWITTADGLNRWQNGHVTVYGKRSVPGQNRRTDERELIINARVTEIANSGLRGTVYSLGQDDRGRLWAGSREGVFYFDRGRFVPVPGVPGGNILSIAGDGHGKVWISNLDHGLFYSTPEGAVQRIPWAQFGHKYAAVALLPDRLQGGLWLGFFDGGIAYLKDGQLRSSYNVADGLGNGSVNDLQLGSDGAVWAATEGGLSRVKDGRVTTLTSRNGLPCDAVNSVIEDNDHSFWLYMACGLVRIARSELDAWVSDSKRSVRTTVFDSSDGVRTRALAGGHSRLVTKSPDSKIWFSPPDGVSFIDPRHLPFNSLPPPVYVQQITTDGKKHDASQGLRLPPRVRNLAIDYTALSLVAPEKMHFRFKLEGQDDDWREVANQRRAEYSNLPPGNYRFRVIASNNSGVWNEEGASLDFAIAPAYYQTNWFRALCAAAILALLWMAYRLRVRQLQHQERKLRDVIETIPTFAWTALPDGSIDFANRNWEEYSGLSTERTVGSGWEAAVHPADLKRHAEKWRACVATGELFESEVRFRRADGEYRWFLVRAVPLRGARGKILKWYGTSTDIEDRKRADAEIRALNEQMIKTQEAERMRISGELHDDVLQQITSLTLRLGKVKRQVPPESEAVVTVNGLQQQLIQIGTDIRHISHELHPVLLQDAGLPAALCAYCEEFSKIREIPVSCEIDESVQELSPGAALCLYRIAQEALGNASKYSEAKKVEVRLTRADGRVHLSVSDDGVGCTPDKVGKSGGLGLVNMRERVLQLNGTFDFDSEPGHGTTVRVTVPFRAAS